MNQTLHLGLLGRDIQHSLSPSLQSINGELARINIKYSLLDLSLRETESLLASNGEVGSILALDVARSELHPIYHGLNVTTPYKERAYRAALELTPQAQTLKAVNTIRWRDGHLIGHNTDSDGVLMSFGELGLDQGCERAVVFGTGGASRAVAYALAKTRCQSIIWISRDRERGEHCLEWCASVSPRLQVAWICADDPDIMSVLRGSTVVRLNREEIRALEWGSVEVVISGAPPLSKDQWATLEERLSPSLGRRFGLQEGGGIMDLNYGENRTFGLRSHAQQTLCHYEDGLRMLVGQGISSFQWWTGAKIDFKSAWSSLCEVMK